MKFFIFINFLILWMLPSMAMGEESLFIKHTQILKITDQIPKSDIARDLACCGYELSDGSYQDFREWYVAEHPAIYIEGLTEIYPNFGINWGLSTGEKGKKYTIDPSLKMGFTYLYPINDVSEFVISAFTTLGGDFEEKSCIADYGVLGSGQEVNCRLAASSLPPERTLDYLKNDRERDWGIELRWNFRF